MAETNTAALRAQGERDARALTVTGRRRADTGRIRRAGKALARTIWFYSRHVAFIRSI